MSKRKKRRKRPCFEARLVLRDGNRESEIRLAQSRSISAAKARIIAWIRSNRACVLEAKVVDVQNGDTFSATEEIRKEAACVEAITLPAEKLVKSRSQRCDTLPNSRKAAETGIPSADFSRSAAYVPSKELLRRKVGAESGNRILAVILGYEGGSGVVLVHHRTSPSLSETVERYVKSSGRGRHWFAHFNWLSICEEDRHVIQTRYILGEKRRGGLGSFMYGLVVTCELSKNPNWEATSLRLDQGANAPQHRFRIPANLRKKTPRAPQKPNLGRVSRGGRRIVRKKTPRAPQKPNLNNNPLERRLGRIAASGESNIRHPWRG